MADGLQCELLKGEPLARPVLSGQGYTESLGAGRGCLLTHGTGV